MSAVAAVLAVPTVASAGVPKLVVNDDDAGSGPAGEECAFPNYSAIQDAVDVAAPGQEILVCAGQYSETVVVDKPVELRGAQAGVDARTRTGARQESVILGDGSSDGAVALLESGVVLDGFVVSNGQNPMSGIGIVMPPSEGNHTIVNNVVTDNSIGISANNAEGSPSTISQNLFADNNRPVGSNSGRAIFADSNADDLTISNNSFENQKGGAMMFTSADTSTPQHTNVTITGNEFSGLNALPARNRLYVLLFATQDSTISDNVFARVPQGVILSDGNDQVTVTGNTITDADAAVEVADYGLAGTNGSHTIAGNTLVDNRVGINLASNLDGTLTVAGNRIAGNTSDGIRNFFSSPLIAAGNWWGCNTGPDTPGCDTTFGTSIDASEFLRLDLDAPAKLAKGKSKLAIASITGAGPCLFPDSTEITFAAVKSSIAPSAGTSECAAATPVTGIKRRGTATVTATLDNATVSESIKLVK